MTNFRWSCIRAAQVATILSGSTSSGRPGTALRGEMTTRKRRANRPEDSELNAFDDELVGAAEGPVLALSPPYFTIGLALLLVAIFIWELSLPGALGAKPDTLSGGALVAAGGLLPSKVFQGEYWRLFTAP